MILHPNFLFLAKVGILPPNLVLVQMRVLEIFLVILGFRLFSIHMPCSI